MDNMTPADVMAITGGKDESFLSGQGIFSLIIIFILLFGGLGGGGLGGGAANAALTRSEMQSGLVTNSMVSKLDNLSQTLNTNTCEIEKTALTGFANTASSVNDLGWRMQQCCCETQQAIREEGNATRALMAEQEMTRVRDLLAQSRDEINNTRQTQYILDQFGRFVTNPPCNPCYNCGCNL